MTSILDGDIILSENGTILTRSRKPINLGNTSTNITSTINTPGEQGSGDVTVIIAIILSIIFIFAICICLAVIFRKRKRRCSFERARHGAECGSSPARDEMVMVCDLPSGGDEECAQCPLSPVRDRQWDGYFLEDSEENAELERYAEPSRARFRQSAERCSLPARFRQSAERCSLPVRDRQWDEYFLVDSGENVELKDYAEPSRDGDEEFAECSLPTEPLFETENILPSFYTWLTEKYKNIRVVRLYVGKQERGQNRSKKVVIVVVIDDLNVIKEDAYDHRKGRFPIICKLWKFLPVEDLNTSPDPEPFLNTNIPSKVEICIQNIAESLFKYHSNLECVSASYYRLKGIGKENKRLPELCIVLYCSCKGVVPLHEKEFPTDIEGIKTDVREGFFYLFGNDNLYKTSTDDLNPLMMGANISKKDDVDKGGTLGGFVTLQNGEIGFITCAHVLSDLSGQCNPSADFEVVQPSNSRKNSPEVCGVHERSCFPQNQSNANESTIDAALVKLTGRVPERGLFVNLTEESLKKIGYSKENLPEYSSGNIRDTKEAGRLMLPCVKSGHITGFTKGMLGLEGAAVRWINDLIYLDNLSSQRSIMFYKQLEIQRVGEKPFADQGDSGAFVFQLDPAQKEDEDHMLHCICMVVGGTSAGYTIATPIEPILGTFNVYMHKFPNEKMDDS